MFNARVIRLLITTLALSACARQLTAQVSLFVSPSGKTGWSGTKETPTADGTDGPLPDIAAARDAIRANRGKGAWLKTRITVNIAPGFYALAEPLEFGAQDNGDENAPIKYVAAKPGSATISGGRRITGWKPAQFNGHEVWAAAIPEVQAGKWYFRQLFVGDARRPRTRLPKEGFYSFAGLPTTRPDTAWPEGQDRATFKPGDMKKWKSLADVDVVALSLWIESHLPVSAIDEATRLVTFGKKSVFRLTNTHTPGDFSRYYIENVAEAFDTPGQWYLERTSGTLYYYPRPGETPEWTEIIAPRLPQVLRITGSAQRAVTSLQFEGLSFAHSDWYLAAAEAGWSQAAAGAPGAVLVSHAKQCAFSKCSVTNVSGYGIELADGADTITIDRCTLTDLGAGGVKLGHNSWRSTVSNCEIGPGGQIFHSAIGVWIGNSGYNNVLHNHIHDFFYTGVSVGWSWGYGLSNAVENRVEYNHIHDIGKDMLADMGGIYTLGLAPGSVLRGNIIHDVSGHGYGGWGIYNDEGSTGFLIENNIVYRTTHGGYHQHYGQHNLIRNNIFAFGNPEVGQIIRSREEDHISFFFEHNIVYYTGGSLTGSTWKNGNWRMDYNDYFEKGGKPIQAGGGTFEAWQQKGNDTHSIVADPGFVDPAHGDFTLKPDSPALRIGFKPIDTSRVGPQPEDPKKSK